MYQHGLDLELHQSLLLFALDLLQPLLSQHLL
jgi:hypothetical protein